MFPARYERDLHIKSKAIPATGHGGPYMFPARYESDLHIKSKAIPVTGHGGPYMFPARYKRDLHIKSKAILRLQTEDHGVNVNPCNRPRGPIRVSCEV
jgi:hypothetical protein